jgi:hypothetical protein
VAAVKTMSIFVEIREEVLDAVMNAIPREWCVNTGYIVEHSGLSRSYVYLALRKLRRSGRVNTVLHVIGKYKMFLYCRGNNIKGLAINHSGKDVYITYEQMRKLVNEVLSNMRSKVYKVRARSMLRELSLPASTVTVIAVDWLLRQVAPETYRGLIKLKNDRDAVAYYVFERHEGV